MDGLGSPELIFIAVIALMLLGPNEVRRLAWKFGRFMRDVQRMSHEFMTELNREADADDERERTEKLEKARAASAGAAKQTAEPDLRGYHPEESAPGSGGAASGADSIPESARGEGSGATDGVADAEVPAARI